MRKLNLQTVYSRNTFLMFQTCFLICNYYANLTALVMTFGMNCFIIEQGY